MLEHLDYSYKFDEIRCSTCEGNCCIGESGYIWITNDEIKKLALFQNISTQDVIQNSLKKVGYRYSINEIKLSKNNYACKFFDIIKKQCSIYDVRPVQCRTFPFWDYFKTNIEELKLECPAIIE
jgi:Fe-S-cluster containining protein